MNCLIITNGYGLADGILHQLKRLKEELTLRNISFDVIKNNKAIVLIDENGDLKSALKPYDFIIYLDKDRFVARSLEKLGYKLFNNALSIELCDDKMLTHIALANNGIKMPKTISSTLCYRDDGNRDIVNDVIQNIGLPLIVKENYGSLGRQVYLINTKEDLEKYNVDFNTASRGMVNIMAGIEGINIWCNFKYNPQNEKVICEFRSRGMSIVDIAKKYGGGGHDQACGATIDSFDMIPSLLADFDNRMEEYLNETNS